jgi:two-component system, NtrC family, sensor histidine kinase AtoS
MSNILSPHTSFPSIWRGKSPGANELNALLNMLNTPAVILEPRHNHVLSANSEFIKLTAYSLAELAQVELRVLFPEISRYELLEPGDHETHLIRHLREPVNVLVRSAMLDQGGSWYILTIIPQEIFQKQMDDQVWQEKYTHAIQNLFSIISQPDMTTSLNLALDVCQFLLHSKIICIYQYDAALSQFKKAASTENKDLPVFPEFIAASSLQIDTQPDIWMPGKRVVNEFHRIGRVAGLSYLATTFLLQEGANLGILAATDPQGVPSQDFERLLQLLGVSISNAMYHHILVQNLNLSLNEHRKALLIRDTALENAQEGIILVNRNLTVENLNPAAEMILGYASQEVVGFPVENILVGTETLIPALKAAMDGIPTHNLGNATLHRRNGQPFLSHLQTIPVVVDDGLLSIVIVLQDISENEQIRVRTQQLEQRALLGEVTAIFAHEVRNPINNISTGLQLLQMKLEPDDPNQEMMTRLQHDCTRLTHLMESVLSFSRPMEYKMDPTDLDILLRRLLDRWRPRFAKANVQAYYQIDPGTLWVTGDARALEQVFTNLVSNAVQAMKNGGLLAVKLANREDVGGNPEVEVTISDNGPGIPDEIKGHIFEPFVTTNPQGTGLGLAITKRIVNAHRGSIGLNSFPGGTVFTVCLPGCKPNGGTAA